VLAELVTSGPWRTIPTPSGMSATQRARESRKRLRKRPGFDALFANRRTASSRRGTEWQHGGYEMHPRTFISHNSADKPVAAAIASERLVNW
jgi:hypothetical protein